VRRLLAGLLLLAVLLVVADRVGVRVAEREVAVQAQRDGGLPERPDVEVRGVPFLTQVVRGRYDDVRLHTAGRLGGAQVRDLDVQLTGVRLPLRDLLAGSVDAVPADRVRGSAVLDYGWLSSQAHGLRVSPDGDRLRVEGSVRVLGRQLGAAASSTVRLDGDAVRVRAQSFSTGSGPVDALLGRALGDRFDFGVRLGALPFGLHLAGLRVRPDGLAVQVAGGPTVLHR
jgi:hypothetical protein